MLTVLQSILSSLVMAGFVIGNVANVFIVLVSSVNWVKRHKMALVDGILTVLALSRIGLLWVVLIYWHATVFNPAIYGSKVIIAVNFAWILSTHFSIWSATCLSMFYLLKITNFSSLVFVYLKWRVKSVLLVIILGSFPLLLSQLTTESIHDNTFINQYGQNITGRTKLKDTMQLSNMAVLTLSNLIPFVMSLTAFVLLIFSLVKHLQKMQLSGRGSRDPSTQVHIKALQMVISFLLLFACYFLALIISVWHSHKAQSKPLFMFCLMLGILYPTSQSFMLIWSNKKLKETFWWFLWHLRC